MKPICLKCLLCLLLMSSVLFAMAQAQKTLIIGFDNENTDISCAKGADSHLSDGNVVCTLPNELFYESFDTNTGTGGNGTNVDQWSGTIAKSTLVADKGVKGSTEQPTTEKWTMIYGYGANKCAKFGTASAKGSAQTPAIAFTGDAKLTFKAGAWYSDKKKLNLSVTNGTLSATSITMENANWTEYTVYITGVTGSTQIKFEADNASNNRFFLDEVRVVKITTIQSLTAKSEDTYYATFSNSNDVIISEENVEVQKVSVNGNTITLSTLEQSSNVKVAEGITINGYYVPANNGVLIKSNSNSVKYYVVENASLADLTNNMLHPASEAMSDSYSGKYYKLAYGNWTGEAATSTDLGFWYGAAEGKAFTAKEGTAYLAVPYSAASKGFSFIDAGDIAAINTVSNPLVDNCDTYNIAGQRVKVNAKGIVIKNGRKYLNN